MSTKRTGLGKGIDALISPLNGELAESVREIDINMIEPSYDQPRQFFDQDKIESLAKSIEEHGIIQPLVVTKEKDRYKLIAGERRWRAARVAGLKKVPVIERDASEQEILEMALIENIQREDLNPIEEALAFSRLLNEHEMTQEKLSEMLGRSRSAIANTLRLLNLNDSIKEMIIGSQISAGHARALLSIEDLEEREKLAREIVAKELSVRQTESLVRNTLLKRKIEEKDDIQLEEDPFSMIAVREVQAQLRSVLGTKVKVDDINGKGKIIIEYYSADERERLIEYLTKE